MLTEFFNVVDFSAFTTYLGDSIQAKYIKNYLLSDDIKAETIVVEHNYIDKDYIIDYSNYYSRSFEDIKKVTDRIHFFSSKFSKKDFEDAFTHSKSSKESLFDSYIGFAVVKPIEHLVSSFPEDGTVRKEKIIGRTILKTYRDKIPKNEDTRYFLTIKNSVNLFGVKLSVVSLPFQPQDIGVGACATASLWVVVQALKEAFDLSSLSLFEITKKSTEQVEEYRNFPSGGLTLRQVLMFLKSIGLDYDILNFDHAIKKSGPWRGKTDESEILSDETDRDEKDNIIPDTVKAFTKYANIPIIAFLEDMGFEDTFGTCTQDESETVYHTAVISGYRSDKYGNVKELYVHDDSLGPYSKVESKDEKVPFLRWKLKSICGTSILKVKYLVIPVYPKMRLEYNEIYGFFSQSTPKNITQKQRTQV